VPEEATPKKSEKTEPWEPNIVGFLCNWCSYAGADLAGTSRIPYACTVRIVRVPCSGRVDPLMILRAFREGADGVLVSGCHPGDCHYIEGNYYARRRFIALKQLLDHVGIDPRRFRVSWVSASEGRKWADVVEKVTADLLEVGPFRYEEDGDD
jgi:F420-non-reducing hydrogenase iron-sulfur subunit